MKLTTLVRVIIPKYFVAVLNFGENIKFCANLIHMRAFTKTILRQLNNINYKIIFAVQ